MGWSIATARGREWRAMTLSIILPSLHDRLLLLLVGLALDAVFGDMRRCFACVPHPVVLAGRAIAAFEGKLNRPNAQRAAPPRARRRHGARAGRRRGRARLGRRIFCASDSLVRRRRRGAGRSRCCSRSAASSIMSPPSRPRSPRRGLAAGRAGGQPYRRPRPDASLDAHGVARAAIESLAENFSDGVVAPVFWYLVLGLPGLFGYKMANTLDSMIGHRSPRYRNFGWAAARFDDLVNLVPARSAASCSPVRHCSPTRQRRGGRSP